MNRIEVYCANLIVADRLRSMIASSDLWSEKPAFRPTVVGSRVAFPDSDADRHVVVTLEGRECDLKVAAVYARGLDDAVYYCDDRVCCNATPEQAARWSRDRCFDWLKRDQNGDYSVGTWAGRSDEEVRKFVVKEMNGE